MDEGIDNLKYLFQGGGKIHSVEEDNEYIYVSVIRGVDLSPSTPEVLVSKYKMNKSEELKKFLLSDTAQNSQFSPKNRGIILIDIAEYSRGNSLLQSAFLVAFQNAIKEILSVHEIYSKGKFIEQIIPTGDGCYIVFHDSLNDRFFRIAFGIISSMHVKQNQLLKEFGREFKSVNRIGIRVGCELGETDFFHDISDNRNCFGTGLNEAARILSCGHKEVTRLYSEKSDLNTIFFGENLLPQARKLHKWLISISSNTQIEHLGSLSDKHGDTRNVYWMHGFSKYFAVNLFTPRELYNL